MQTPTFSSAAQNSRKNSSATASISGTACEMMRGSPKYEIACGISWPSGSQRIMPCATTSFSTAMDPSAYFISRSRNTWRPSGVVTSSFSSLNQPRGLVVHLLAERQRNGDQSADGRAS